MTFKEFVERIKDLAGKGKFYTVGIIYTSYNGFQVRVYIEGTDEPYYANSIEGCLSQIENVTKIPEIEIDEKLFYPEGRE